MGPISAMELSSNQSSPPRQLHDPVAIPSDETVVLATRLASIVLIVGIAVRLVRYLLRFPLWGDECMLAENVLARESVGHLEAMTLNQVAPYGFIEATRGMIRLFGFNEWSLRFISIAASVTSLVAMRQLAFRMLPPLAALFAFAFVAAGYYPMRHSAELKPYALDLAWTVFLLWIAERWCHVPSQRRWISLLITLTPVAILTSFPSVFVAGGICLGLFVHAFVRRSHSDLMLVAIYGLVIVISFALVYWLTATDQYETNGQYMLAYWQNSFPPSPIREPISWLGWMIETHTGEMFAHPAGGNGGGSTLTLLVAIIGLTSFWPINNRWFVMTSIGTFGLGYLAATLRRYPYGENERLVQYLGPIICLLAGAGTSFLVDRVRTIHTRRMIILTITSILCIGITGVSIRDLIRPYKSRFDMVHRGFACWFWQPEHDTTETYCARTDLGYNFWPKSWQSQYLCYQRIYSPRHRKGTQLRLIPDLSLDRPVNIVVYSNEGDPSGGELWDEWMSAMTKRFKLLDSVDHRVLVDHKKQEDTWGHYRVYRFAPKGE